MYLVSHVWYTGTGQLTCDLSGKDSSARYRSLTGLCPVTGHSFWSPGHTGPGLMRSFMQKTLLIAAKLILQISRISFGISQQDF